MPVERGQEETVLLGDPGAGVALTPPDERGERGGAGCSQLFEESWVSAEAAEEKGTSTPPPLTAALAVAMTVRTK